MRHVLRHGMAISQDTSELIYTLHAGARQALGCILYASFAVDHA